MKNLISIIIVNWNGKKWLKKCFDSLHSQTYNNFEVIFVDNASSDDSVGYVEKNYTGTVIIKSNKNLGFAGGVNLGIKNTNDGYILLMNNDTWIDDDFLERILFFYQNNNFDVVAPMENDYGNQAKEKNTINIDILGHCIYQKYLSNKTNFYLCGVCLFFKKALYEETLGLDNNFLMYFEEVDWFWRLHLLNKTIASVDNLFIHHASVGSISGGIKYESFLWRNQNTLQMLLKNYACANLLWVLPLYFFQNIAEIIFFLLILKPKIALSYFQGWWFNVKNIRKILINRSWVQKNRTVSDTEIFKKMYFGFAKFYHLANFLKNKS